MEATISGIESHMSGEGQSTFQLQVKKKLCKQPKVRTGPRTDPCGSPNETGVSSDLWQCILTEWVLFVRYDKNILKPCLYSVAMVKSVE